MPRGDGIGPLGFGPRTGRAAGYCAGFPGAGYMNPQPGFKGAGFGRGRGWGRGLGRGWGRGLGRGVGRGRMYGMPGRASWMQFCHPEWAVPTCQPGTAYPYPVVQGVPAYGTPYPGYDPEYEAEATTEHEVSFLKEQTTLLKEELEAVERRLDELGKQKTDSTDKDE